MENETTLCDCCDKLIRVDRAYWGFPDLNSGRHTICRDCARRYTWIYLEDPDGRRLLDRIEPTYWTA